MILTNSVNIQEPLLNKSSRKQKTFLLMTCLVLFLGVIAYFSSHDSNVLHSNEVVVLSSNEDEIINELNKLTQKFGAVSTSTKVAQTISDVFSYAGYIGTAFSTAVSAFHFFTNYQNDRYIKAINELTKVIEENQRETMDALGQIQSTIWQAQMSEPYSILNDLHLQLQIIFQTGNNDKCLVEAACGEDFSKCRTAFLTMNTVALALINDVQTNEAFDYNYGNFKGQLDTEKSRNLLDPIMYTIMQGYLDLSQAQAFLTHPYNSSVKYSCDSNYTISTDSMKSTLFTFEYNMNKTYLNYQTLSYKMRSFSYQYVDISSKTWDSLKVSTPYRNNEMQYITGIYLGGWWVDEIDGFINSVAPDEGYTPSDSQSDRQDTKSTRHEFDNVPGTGTCSNSDKMKYNWFLNGLELEPKGMFNYGIWYIDKFYCAKMRTQVGSKCRSQSVNSERYNWIYCPGPGEYISSVTRSYNKQGLDSIGEIECCTPTFNYTPIELRTKP